VRFSEICVVAEMEDLSASVDVQDVYTKIKCKVVSFNIDHFRRRYGSANTHTHTHTRTSTHTQTHVPGPSCHYVPPEAAHTHTQLRLHAHTHALAHTRMHTHTHACTRTCTHTQTCTERERERGRDRGVRHSSQVGKLYCRSSNSQFHFKCENLAGRGGT